MAALLPTVAFLMCETYKNSIGYISGIFGWKIRLTMLQTGSPNNSRLATTVVPAYDVIEMFAPAAPPIMLRFGTHSLNPNPKP